MEIPEEKTNLQMKTLTPIFPDLLRESHPSLPFLPHLSLLKVQVLANGCEQAAKALKGLLIVVFQQLHHAVVHDGLCQHLQFEKLANKFYIPDGSPPGFVLGLFQLVMEPRLLLWL